MHSVQLRTIRRPSSTFLRSDPTARPNPQRRDVSLAGGADGVLRREDAVVHRRSGAVLGEQTHLATLLFPALNLSTPWTTMSYTLYKARFDSTYVDCIIKTLL